MGKYSDIVNDEMKTAWSQTEAADDFKPLPAGDYVAHITAGELETSKTKGTPGYKLEFTVIEPAEHASRKFWHDVWLTPAALPMAKRDLAKIGVTELEQLERPLPAGMRCNVKLTLRKDDDDVEHNRIRRFEVIGIDEPERDAFAGDDGESTGSDAA